MKNPSPAPAAGRKAAVMSREDAAEYIGLKPQTLAKWFSDGNFDLPCVKVGRLAKYRQVDLDDFLARHTLTANS